MQYCLHRVTDITSISIVSPKHFRKIAFAQVRNLGDITQYLYTFIYIYIYWVMVGMATRASNNHISWSGIGLRENTNSLGYQYWENCQWMGTGVTQVLQGRFQTNDGPTVFLRWKRRVPHGQKRQLLCNSFHLQKTVGPSLVRNLPCSTCITPVPIHWQFSQYCYHRLLMFSLNTQSPLCLCGYYWPSWPFLPLLNKYIYIKKYINIV